MANPGSSPGTPTPLLLSIWKSGLVVVPGAALALSLLAVPVLVLVEALDPQATESVSLSSRGLEQIRV